MKILMSLVLVLAAVGFSSCAKIEDVIDKTQQIPSKMDTLAANTDELKRLTIVAEMKKELEDTKNYKVLTPVPYDLNAAAKKAAENFKVDEVVPWTYNLLSKINNAKYEDNFGTAANANNPEAVQFEKDKLGTISALAAVAGFLPEATINLMIEKVNNSEEYTPTILAMFAMRAYFINNVLMKEKYGSSKLTEIGTVEQAIYYNTQVENLLKLPYAALVKIQVTGFDVLTDYNDGLTYGLDMESAKNNWTTIAYGMSHFVKVSQYSTDQSQVNSQLARQKKALDRINLGLQSWGVEPIVLP